MKMLKFAASMAMAIVLMSCGCSKNSSNDAVKEAEENAGSAKGGAERFVKAIVQGNVDSALAACNTVDFGGSRPRKRSKAEMQELKAELENLGKRIGDDKLEVKAIQEEIKGGPKYIIVDGQKFTAQAKVTVQFIKGKDKKSEGIEVQLIGGGETWKVISYKMVSGLDLTDGSKGKVTEGPKTGKPVPKAADVKAAEGYVPSAKKADYGSSSKVREFESLCRELAAEAKKTGKKLDEGEIREEIEKFRKLSSDEQDKQLREGKRMLEMLKTVKDLK